MDEELLRGRISSWQPPARQEPSSDLSPSDDDPATDDDLPAPELPAVHRYLVQLIVDRDEANALYRRFVPDLQRVAQHSAESRVGRSRLLLRSSLIRGLVALQQSEHCPLPIPELNASTEEARFDAIWRTELLERTWQRLRRLQEETGQPYFLALRQRSETPGLSAPELADRIAHVLDRPISTSTTQRLLRRANSQFSRMLLEEVIATLPENPPFETIERELIETNLLAFCREAIGSLRHRSSPPHRRPIG
ncbi:hypothetical protein [Tautonia rosea]|uniref:hypothetical protein n=1 Tax=Tautonia rosea TaxID=2728037 RepID=UPI001472E9FC|nr:hypothetical protein [Tautonia rosea]